MSLDVSLYLPPEVGTCECPTCGNSHPNERQIEVFEYNITHNLNRMAMEAGVYQACWRPEEQGWAYARDLIAPLEVGLALLTMEPDRFVPFNPSNKWGNYDGLVEFIEKYLIACRLYPDATIYVSR